MHLVLRFGAVWLLSCWLTGAAGAASYPTPAETRAEFEAICRRLQEGDNLYFGQAIVPWLQARLQEPEPDLAKRAVTWGMLGFELIRLDRLEEAITALEKGIETADRAGLPAGDRQRRRLQTNLAFAHLQLAEDQNCIERHTARSCILPIAAEAVHTRPDRARTAGDQYLRLAQTDPNDVLSRWLLNVARMLSGDYPDGVPAPLRLPAGALQSASPFPEWRNRAPELGVDAFDLAGGAVMEDLDGDGLLDLVTSSSDPCEPMKAWRNDGAGGFDEVTREWGLDGQLGGLNMVHADYDGDGRPDLLVLRGGWLGAEGRIRNSLLRNDLAGESGRFQDVTSSAGIAYPAYPTQTAGWADYDADGDLDLYVGNEEDESSTNPAQYRAQGTAYPSQLFRNNGDGTFTDVARAAGVVNRRFTKGVAWGDYDNDGDPDLYLSTYSDNRLYRNEGDGAFTDVAGELGVTGPVGSFPTWWFDYDNDGDLDLFAAEYAATFEMIAASYFTRVRGIGNPRLYRNEGGRFVEVASTVGLDRPTLPMGANYGDLDNDGWLDLYLGTGEPQFVAIMPNLMYRNREGRTFEDVTFAGGFGHLQKGHGVAFGDLDNDGDQDLYEQMGGALPYDTFGNVLYENPGNDNAWIVLRLQGARANRFAVGARIEVRVRQGETRRSVHVLAGTGGSFGGSSLQQEIGLGSADAIESIVVVWPGSGTRQVFTGVAPNAFYRAVEGEPELTRLEVETIRLGGGEAPHRHGAP